MAPTSSQGHPPPQPGWGRYGHRERTVSLFHRTPAPSSPTMMMRQSAGPQSEAWAPTLLELGGFLAPVILGLPGHQLECPSHGMTAAPGLDLMAGVAMLRLGPLTEETQWETWAVCRL